MSVKLGVAPIAWSNDDMPELGGETSLEQCLSEARQAGYIGIESGGKFPKISSELIPKLEKFNLQLCSGWYGANLRKNSVNDEKMAIQEQLTLFKDCKAPCIVFAEVSGSIQSDPNRKLSARPQMDNEEWNNFCKKISELAKYLEDQGMPLGYHHHMGTVIETQKDTERLLENTHESVKLTLDTGHMLFAKGDSKKILSDFSDRLIHLHCKDIRKKVLENSLKNDLSFRAAFLDGAFTVPGDGCIDYRPLFEVLKEKNYSGWLVVEAEQDPKKANPLEYAIKGYNYLRETLSNLKIEIKKK
jgi:inosose dehydratase|tara:strand:+ start:1539 stop:2441 length:903 start_codon:yes stop_codon:yes gene_type:complete